MLEEPVTEQRNTKIISNECIAYEKNQSLLYLKHKTNSFYKFYRTLFTSI